VNRTAHLPVKELLKKMKKVENSLSAAEKLKQWRERESKTVKSSDEIRRSTSTNENKTSLSITATAPRVNRVNSAQSMFKKVENSDMIKNKNLKSRSLVPSALPAASNVTSTTSRERGGEREGEGGGISTVAAAVRKRSSSISSVTSMQTTKSSLSMQVRP
jgi:hypothetical protein